MLSGYLITGLLIDEHASAGTVDLARFWLRRARRLLPALFVVVAVVAIWISNTTPPFELGLRRSDLLWTIFYGANWHFIATGQDYFAQFASVSPVLHTWSLSIEEQFYLTWPIVTLAVLRLTWNRAWSIAVVAVVGIVASVIAMAALYDPSDPSRAYYGTDGRIHELLVGALLSALVRAGISLPSRIAPVVAAGALLVVTAGFVLLPDDAPAYYFGGSLAFAVVVAGLLWAVDTAPSSLVSRALSLRPAVWLGRISYGVYLWHWPLVIMFSSAPLTALVLTISLAAVSFYLLEQPIRRGRLPLVRRSGRRFAALWATAAALLVATTVWATNVPAGGPTISATIAGCSVDGICIRHREADSAPVLGIIGDSIARSLDPAFRRLAERHRWTYVLAAPNGCRIDALVDSAGGVVRPRDRECPDVVRRLRGELLATWHPQIVIAIDRWEINDAVARDGHVAKSGTPEHLALTADALNEVALEFSSAGTRLVFIELPPILAPECAEPGGANGPGCRRRVDEDDLDAPYNDVFRRIAAEVPGVSTISIVDAICPHGLCVMEVNGVVLRPDGTHFAESTGSWLGDVIDNALANATFESKPR